MLVVNKATHRFRRAEYSLGMLAHDWAWRGWLFDYRHLIVPSMVTIPPVMHDGVRVLLVRLGAVVLVVFSAVWAPNAPKAKGNSTALNTAANVDFLIIVGMFMFVNW